nr:MAG TPA: hypothetical protein [Caudoviricetes sp.]
MYPGRFWVGPSTETRQGASSSRKRLAMRSFLSSWIPP